MAKNPPENIPIILFCFDFWKQTCVILLPVGCSHDLTNLQHKKAHQRTSALFCVGDQSRCNCTYGTLLYLSDWSIITDDIMRITMISSRYRKQKIVNEYSPTWNRWNNLRKYRFCYCQIVFLSSYPSCFAILSGHFLLLSGV